MMLNWKTNYVRLLECFILFILMPVCFSLAFDFRLKLLLGLIGFVYIVFVLLKVEKVKFYVLKDIKWKPFVFQTSIKFILIVILSLLYVLITNDELLFKPIKTDIQKWLLFVLIYAFLSVYPQEIVYRTFFFRRYRTLFKSNELFLFLNAVLFSLGHIFFRNTLVLVITCVGGLLFALNYSQNKSTVLVSLEHALYGSWLYTVGMGGMLGFPD